MGYISEKQNKWAEAGSFYEQAINLLEKQRYNVGEIAGIEAKERLIERNIDVYKRIVRCLLKLNKPDEAFSYAERCKARTMLELLYDEAPFEQGKGFDHTIVDVKTIQDSLLEDTEVLVEYLQGEDSVYVFIIGKKHFDACTLPISSGELNNHSRRPS